MLAVSEDGDTFTCLPCMNLHPHAAQDVHAGMYTFAALNLFQPKQLPKLKLLPLALAFVGYVVTQNVSLRLNTVGFYQISKISITPGVLVLEAVLFKRYPTTKELLSVVVVCLGVALATVTDTQVKPVAMAVRAQLGPMQRWPKMLSGPCCH